MYDYVIVGGGPAGATLGRLINKKYKVLILEKRTFEDKFESPSQKCCGGLLAPDAQKMLAKFGLGIPNSVLQSPQLFAVRTIDINNSVEKYYQRHYINIDRQKFDRWLLSLVSSNVEIKTGCIFKKYEKKDNELVINYTQDGKSYSLRTKYLIGADGANSMIRRKAFKYKPMPQKYISIQDWFATNDEHSYYGAIFDEEITDFYSWIIPKQEYLIIGSALKDDSKAIQKFELLKQKLIKYGFNLENKVKRNGAFIMRPKKLNQICLGEENIILVGEAAGFISPSSAEGISYAFRSAMELAQAIELRAENVLSNYEKRANLLKMNIICKNLKSPAMYQSTIRKTIMKSGIMSIKLHK
ncbi:FAD-binding protein [Abyssisolibacter fermentans]|uniref:FAD-binding protein n=1 Tax=Abyssisolibacter fermentans TaxID=1766203 RepID=UPI000829B424|nr:FAD-binding protein [Abyssisolibacter fermentans]